MADLLLRCLNPLDAVLWENPALAAYASHAVDGDPNTVAAAAGSYAWTLHQDLGAVQARLDTVKVTFAENGYATEYQILLSVDGSTWTQTINETYSRYPGELLAASRRAESLPTARLTALRLR